MIKKVLFGAAATAAAVMVPAAAAFADSCANVSRSAHAPAACWTNCPNVVTVGNWVWLPSLDSVLGVQLPLRWGFVSPGASDSQFLQTPGANGNYTNGQTSSLLGMSAICNGGATARQVTNGIQSHCE